MDSFGDTHEKCGWNCNGGVPEQQSSFKYLMKDNWGSLEFLWNEPEEKYETPFRYIDVEEQFTQTITRVRQSEQREPTIIDLIHEKELRVLYGPPINYPDTPEYDRPYIPTYIPDSAKKMSRKDEEVTDQSETEDTTEEVEKSEEERTEKEEKMKESRDETIEKEEKMKESEEVTTENNENVGRIVVYVEEYDDAGDFEDL